VIDIRRRMGILLSKDADVPEHRFSEEITQQSSRKRKRKSRNAEAAQRPPKKRVKVARTVAPCKTTNDVQEAEFSEKQEAQTRSNSFERAIDTGHAGPNQPNDILEVTSDVGGRPSKDSETPMEKQLGLSEIQGDIPIEKEASEPLATELPQTPTKAKRKQKPVTSPYFKHSKPQLCSPSATPTSSDSDKALNIKSKISIVESYDKPPSLQHFRPTSSNEFGLIQEKLRHDPWKMLVAVIFLNVTTAKMALPLLAQLFERWPTPEALSQADFDELSAFLYPIGLYNTRAKRLIEFSSMWLREPPRLDALTKRKGLAKYPPTAISHLPGVVSWRLS
jgi:hypothetical protein